MRDRIGGWKGRAVAPVAKLLARLIHQDELNDMLCYADGLDGSCFSEAIYDYLELGLEVEGLDRIPEGRRYVFACNHPLGGLDGIGLVKVLGGRYGDDNVRFLVNDMLMHVEPLRGVFLPINKYGAQGRGAAAGIAAAFGSDRQMVVFPAGLVSRLHDDGGIKDLAWRKSFVQKAVESGRDIVPVRFEGHNRMRFYRLARWRKKLGIKVNLEQALLPAEFCATRGRKFRVVFGEPVSCASLSARREAGESFADIAASLRTLVYDI